MTVRQCSTVQWNPNFSNIKGKQKLLVVIIIDHGFQAVTYAHLYMLIVYCVHIASSHILCTFTSSWRNNLSWLRSDVINYRVMKPWYSAMQKEEKRLKINHI